MPFLPLLQPPLHVSSCVRLSDILHTFNVRRSKARYPSSFSFFNSLCSTIKYFLWNIFLSKAIFSIKISQGSFCVYPQVPWKHQFLVLFFLYKSPENFTISLIGKTRRITIPTPPQWRAPQSAEYKENSIESDSIGGKGKSSRSEHLYYHHN